MSYFLAAQNLMARNKPASRNFEAYDWQAIFAYENKNRGDFGEEGRHRLNS